MNNRQQTNQMEENKMRFIEMPNEINFESTIKTLGEINERIYGMNPYKIEPEPDEADFIMERSNEITQDNVTYADHLEDIKRE